MRPSPPAPATPTAATRHGRRPLQRSAPAARTPRSGQVPGRWCRATAAHEKIALGGRVLRHRPARKPRPWAGASALNDLSVLPKVSEELGVSEG
jgi:hypothetical protein